MSIFGAAVSGMNAETNWLSTIAQNIANSNTTGYKSGAAEFASLIDQASAGSYQAGGGVIASMRSLNSLQGSIVGGGTATDLAIQGNGYFVVSDASGASYLTRNGAFAPDASGNLVNSAGFYLMGYDTRVGTTTTVANALTGMDKVNVGATGQEAVATTAGVFTANLPATATIVPSADLPSTNAASAAYTDKTSLVAYDNLGGARTIDIYMSKTADNTWEVAAYDHAGAAAAGGFPYASGPIATQSLSFDPTSGKLSSGSPFTVAIPGGKSMALDLSGMTQLSASYAISTATTNGNAPNSLTGVSIGTDGVLSFQFSDGASIAAYKIPLANVPSPDNMTSVTGTAFQVNQASGPVTVGSPGQAGLGTLATSSLESSTVDLATQLTDMIQAQSAYQSNSKVFQTGADILSILNNLKA